MSINFVGFFLMTSHFSMMLSWIHWLKWATVTNPAKQSVNRSHSRPWYLGRLTGSPVGARWHREKGRNPRSVLRSDPCSRRCPRCASARPRRASRLKICSKSRRCTPKMTQYFRVSREKRRSDEHDAPIPSAFPLAGTRHQASNILHQHRNVALAIVAVSVSCKQVWFCAWRQVFSGVKLKRTCWVKAASQRAFISDFMHDVGGKRRLWSFRGLPLNLVTWLPNFRFAKPLHFVTLAALSFLHQLEPFFHKSSLETSSQHGFKKCVGSPILQLEMAFKIQMSKQ